VFENPDLSRRCALSSLALWATSALFSPACSLSRSNLVRLSVYRRPCDRTDTPAFNRAILAGAPILLAGGDGTGPGGVYLIDSVLLPSGCWIEGEGPSSVVVLIPKEAVAALSQKLKLTVVRLRIW